MSKQHAAEEEKQKQDQRECQLMKQQIHFLIQLLQPQRALAKIKQFPCFTLVPSDFQSVPAALALMKLFYYCFVGKKKNNNNKKNVLEL